MRKVRYYHTDKRVFDAYILAEDNYSGRTLLYVPVVSKMTNCAFVTMANSVNEKEYSPETEHDYHINLKDDEDIFKTLILNHLTLPVSKMKDSKLLKFLRGSRSKSK